MRGKVPPDGLKIIRPGITPAYAGKSAPLLLWSGGVWDHPRLCGEKHFDTLFRFFVTGSPPPMRGKGPPAADVWKRSGITPAYAGKRIKRSVGKSTEYGSPPPMRGKVTITTSLDCIMRDHPRLCGEKCPRLQALPLLWGSPPPMRGKAKVYVK